MKTKLAQTILKDAGLYTGKVDGDFGKVSQTAAYKYYNFPGTWNSERLVAGIIQVAAIRAGIQVGEIDGLWGNMTEAAYEKLLKKDSLVYKKPEVSQVVDIKKRYNDWPKQDYDSMVKFYGKVGTNQTSLQLPYPMYLAWDKDSVVSKITCHEKVHDSLERILKNTLDHYGIATIKELKLDSFGGCLNVRKMRGGSSWSIHSWGAAIDLDPDRNQLKWDKTRAYFARPEYAPFWKIVEAEGWTSLGKARNYDFMHMQAANL
jgi:peptidoglycan hydrolase-like protein with peptidoglycan-binding domain